MILNLCSAFLTFNLLLCPHVPFAFQTVDVRLVYYRGEVGEAILCTQEHFKVCSGAPVCQREESVPPAALPALQDPPW